MASGIGSLVSNILQKSSALDDNVIDDSLQKLEKKTITLKGQICEIIKAEYINFDSYVDSTVNLEQKLTELTAEYRRVSTRIEQELKGRLLKSTDKREELKGRLQEIETRIISVEALASVYQDLESSKADIKAEKFVSASQKLNGALLKVEGGKCEAKVCRALVQELTKELSSLNLRLQEEWNRAFMWTPRHVHDKTTVDAACGFQLKVHLKPAGAITHLNEVIIAMKIMDDTAKLWPKTVQSFGERLLAILLKPTVLYPELRIVKSQQDNGTLVRFERSNDASDTIKMYKGLETIFSVARSVMPEDCRAEWAQELGRLTFMELSDLIIKHRLSTSIPKDAAQLDEYQTLIDRTAEFEKTLVTLGFIGEGCTPLSQYTNDVHIHVAAMKCQDLLTRARSILMKPIHDTVAVKPQEVLKALAPLCIPIATAMLGKDGEEEANCKGMLDGLTFEFPLCQVSKSVVEFRDLLNQILSDCTHCTTFAAASQLLYSARMAVELFCAVLPCYHKASIAAIPRAAAVQHNNCMYLAHHLFALGYQFYSRLPEQVNTLSTTFVDQAVAVRQLGQDCFTSELKKQSAIILDSLKAVPNFKDVSSPGKGEEVDKCARHVVLHLTQLSRVYGEVLPTGIYHKSIGILLNLLVTHVVNAILALEDISSTDCTELSRIVEWVVKSGPSVLLGGVETLNTKICPGWSRLEQLATVLNCGLQDIVNAWDSGSGQLAKDFSALEIRGLVKALFQNTERRAAALAKISL